MIGIDTTELLLLAPLAISVLFGMLIGLERESRHKVAGIGTNMLIAAGACIFTLLSSRFDPSSPSRIASNVLTGVGFIGAGLILKESDGNIHGLTTAAGIWLTAAVGMAVGFGYFVLAGAGTLVAIFAPRIPGWLHQTRKTPPNPNRDELNQHRPGQ